MTTNELVQKYTKQLQSLNRASNKALGKAPHKPILLLSNNPLNTSLQKGSELR